MRRATAWCALAFLAAATPAAAAPDPSGTWRLVRGRNTDRSRYSGEVRVRREGEDAWRVAWSTTVGDYDGVGVLLGRRLVVAWGTSAEAGLLVAARAEDGSLVGSWWELRRPGRPGRERAVPSPALGDGAYVVEGVTPDGEPYAGRMWLGTGGGCPAVRWEVAGSSWEGVACEVGGNLVMSFGEAGASGLAVYRVGRWRLAGWWLAAGVAGRGREVLRGRRRGQDG